MLAADIIALLGLRKHPEAGWYRETFRDARTDENGRAASTLIYYLLEAGDVSHWHRVDAAEVWHYYAGAPLLFSLSETGEGETTHRLGVDLSAGERPQCVVPAGWWQSARSTGTWTLVGCTVAPGFEFSGFEMAPEDWRPATFSVL